MKTYSWEKMDDEVIGYCFKCGFKGPVSWRRKERVSFPGQGESIDETNIDYCCSVCAKGKKDDFYKSGLPF